MLQQSPELAMVILVIVIEWLLPLGNRFHIENLFIGLANAIRVKLRLQRTNINHTLNGVLALVFYLVFIAIVLFAVLFAFENDVWTQGFLLYLSLSLSTHTRVFQQLRPLLENNQKSAARTLLATITIWDTTKLSLLGINKLILELLIFRFVHGWLFPLIAFGLFGAAGSLLYIAIVATQFAWLSYDKKISDFGQFSTRMLDTLSFIPSLFLAPMFSVFCSSPGWLNTFSNTKKQWTENRGSLTHLLWLAIVSAGCKCELAGPLMLNDHKVPRPRINFAKAIGPEHITQLLNWIVRFKIFTLTLLVTVLLIIGLK
ncbi:cobalamin biosynthesis protein [Psychrosphaera sp. 1_MG-2023]|uniref:cobalamin biosynthesis protein n=1 Tax=Psychrosphaera sp. 1_MG-2023 TaxID=3062643 RepID=UPI0026E34B3F|nr:cobalamin biosynthesis protein [Psychrosphaera sp. 1_MG-2023]MDO6719236.1 cobalamin biosynthesis protein [Psychrosphaera sp. 1_MG-2023]